MRFAHTPRVPRAILDGFAELAYHFPDAAVGWDRYPQAWIGEALSLEFMITFSTQVRGRVFLSAHVIQPKPRVVVTPPFSFERPGIFDTIANLPHQEHNRVLTWDVNMSLWLNYSRSFFKPGVSDPKADRVSYFKRTVLYLTPPFTMEGAYHESWESLQAWCQMRYSSPADPRVVALDSGDDATPVNPGDTADQPEPPNPAPEHI